MQHVYYILAAAVIILCLVTIFILRKKLKSPHSVQDLYIQGLNEIILGDADKALYLLRKLVRSNTDYIDAYIHISNILCNRGDNNNAIRILRDLLTRPELNQKQEKLIIKYLAVNYWECQQYNWTLYACNRLLAIDKKNEWAKQKQIECFEKMHDWHNAFIHLQKTSGLPKAQKQDILSLYKVQEGKLESDHSGHQARLCYREAIKIKTTCFPAYLELVKSYIQERRTKNALKELRRLVQKMPHMASIALEELSPDLYELGQFEQVESLYLSLLKSKQEHIDVYLGLAGIKEKKGEIEKAIELNKKAYEKSKSEKICLQIIRLESILEQHDAIKQITNNIPQYRYESTFKCVKCGYQTNLFFWHCPQCASWNSAKRDRE